MWRLLRWIALVGIVALAASSRKSAKTVHEIADDELRTSKPLRYFVDVVSRVNDESNDEYKKALQGIRENSEETLDEASRILAQKSEASFGLKHTTLMAVTALQSESALSVLERVALNPQPLPPREISDPEGPEAEQRVQSEILALDAVDGIAALAIGGSREALDRLVAGAAHGSRAVALAAIAALGSRSDWKEQHARARSALPVANRELGQARYAAVDEIPQVADPRRHLAGVEQGVAKPPSIEAGASRSRKDDRRASAAPMISKESDNG